MRALLVLSVLLLAAQVACAPVVEVVPLSDAELHSLEAEAREAHPHTTLRARDLHPHTPVLIAILDETGNNEMPAFIVEREVAVNLLEADEKQDMDVSDQHEAATEDEQTQTAEDEDDDALIESDFEISAPYGGYGAFGGYGYGGYGGKKVPYKQVPYKKVPYKKVPYKKVPYKKGPPKKFPPKKAPPKKTGGGFGFGAFGYGGGFGGHH